MRLFNRPDALGQKRTSVSLEGEFVTVCVSAAKHDAFIASAMREDVD